jgi:peroxiredoxin
MPKILFAFLLTQITLFACTTKKEEPHAAAAQQEMASTNEYPNISLRLTDGKEIQANTLKGKNVFVLFQPECDHCQEEAIQIEQRLEEFRNYTLYFISSAPIEQIDGFARNFRLHEKENVKFAWTSTQGVLDHYGPIPTPSVYVYSDGRLRQSFKGQTPIDNILKSL